MTIATETSTIDRLLGHDAWATRVLLERCRDLTPAQFSQKFEMGLGTTHDTLLHIVGAMYRWADRIGGRPLRPRLEDEPRTWTPDEIMARLDDCAPDLAGVVKRVVTEDRLDEKMEFVVADQPPFVFTRGTAIVHVTTHGVHHRAQALNMLRRLGLNDLPNLDAVEWELAGKGD